MSVMMSESKINALGVLWIVSLLGMAFIWHGVGRRQQQVADRYDAADIVESHDVPAGIGKPQAPAPITNHEVHGNFVEQMAEALDWCSNNHFRMQDTVIMDGREEVCYEIPYAAGAAFNEGKRLGMFRNIGPTAAAHPLKLGKPAIYGDPACCAELDCKYVKGGCHKSKLGKRKPAPHGNLLSNLPTYGDRGYLAPMWCDSSLYFHPDVEERSWIKDGQHEGIWYRICDPEKRCTNNFIPSDPWLFTAGAPTPQP